MAADTFDARKCAALKPCRAFFGVGTFPCKNITGDHFQPASQRTGAALSSRFLIPLLTMWGGGLWSDPKGRVVLGVVVAQPPRGPFHAKAHLVGPAIRRFPRPHQSSSYSN